MKKKILTENNGRFYLSDTPADISELLDIESLEQVQNHKAVKDIIEIALKQQHGTLIVFSSSIESEIDRLSKANRCTRISTIDLSNHSNFIIPLSSIDGALMCDFEGNCYGLGAILDGVATVKGDLGRGARYNSAMNYIAWKKTECPKEEYIAAVVSEDGNLNIFSTNTLDLNSLCSDESNG